MSKIVIRLTSEDAQIQITSQETRDGEVAFHEHVEA